MLTQKKRYCLLHYLFASGSFLLVGLLVNRQLKITGLYMDDLYLWSCFGETELFQYLFPVGSQRFRFIFNGLAYFVIKFTGPNLGLLVPINIVLNTLVALWLFHMTQIISESRAVGYLSGSAYMLSHFAYYQIGQMYGLLETFSLMGVLLVLYGLYQYLNSPGKPAGYYYWGTIVIYFFTCFIHERYLVLIIPMLLAVILKRIMGVKEKRDRHFAAAALLGVFIILLIRFLAIGSLSPAGTGGTNVSDTFTIKGAFRYAVDQLLYLAGIHAGPAYLNGIEWNQVPIVMKLMVFCQIAAITGMLLLASITWGIEKESRKKHFCNSVLFFVFIAMCIGSSSVTIRLEIRWIYVSYAAALCYFSYLYKTIRHTTRRYRAFRIAVGCYFVLLIPVELFYRSHYPGLYFWSSQQRYNSLADVTYGSYGTEIFHKHIIVLENNFEMDDFTARTFLKPYNKKWKNPNQTITFADSIYDFGLVTNNMLILAEDETFDRYLDITDFVRELKCDVKYGYYEDRWMDQQAEMEVITGKSGKIVLSGFYPGTISGLEELRITVNRNETTIVPVTGPEIYAELPLLPNQRYELQFSANFYVENALEQRGKYPLCALIDIKAD